MSIFMYAFLGLLTHLIIKFTKARKKENFNFKDWIADRLPDIALTIIAVIVFMNDQKAILSYFNVPENVIAFLSKSTTFAFLLGYTGSSILRNVLSTIMKYFNKKNITTKTDK